MFLRRLPDNWNCMIASLAMLLRCDYEDVERELVRDWTLKPFEGSNEMLGVHIEELQYVAYLRNKFLVPYVSVVRYCPVEGFNTEEIHMLGRFANVLKTHDGMLLGSYVANPGRNHAVVWNHEEKLIYAPERRTCRLAEFNVDCFHAIIEGRTN